MNLFLIIKPADASDRHNYSSRKRHAKEKFPLTPAPEMRKTIENKGGNNFLSGSREKWLRPEEATFA
jgi:hypothetical protein